MYENFKAILLEAKQQAVNYGHLTGRQRAELVVLLDAELRELDVIPSVIAPTTKQYELFFDRLRRLKWLGL